MSNKLEDLGLKSDKIKLNNYTMHYLEQGNGMPLIFLHGVPTWSYLWRNIMPQLSEHWRCIAPDMLGFGLSDKPKRALSIFEHIEYLGRFIEAMEIEQCVLVMHGWGSVSGFDYAMANPDKVKGLVFMESHVRANSDWSMLSLPLQEIAESMLSDDDRGESLILNTDYYLTQVFKPGILRNLNEEEWTNYRLPFQEPGSNKVIWQYLLDLPLKLPNPRVLELIENYSAKLQQSTIPKLMFYATPGFITTMDTVVWAKQNLPEMTLVDLGDALHYPQESSPELIRTEIGNWLLQAQIGVREGEF